MAALTPVPTSAKTHTEKKPRTRQSHHKVRSGCITCKIRRKKCDETKPHCIRCTSTGRTCDGYEQQHQQAPSQPSQSAGTATRAQQINFVSGDTGTIEHQTPESAGNNEHRRTQGTAALWRMIPRLPAMQLFVSELDLQCFDYFRLITAQQLGAYHDSTIWRNFVVRAALTHPVILKSTAALGAAHRRYDLGISREAFEYCAISDRLFKDATRALDEFGSQSSQDPYDHEVTMVAKLLHGVFHIFQGDYDLATKNMTQGLATMWNTPLTTIQSRTQRLRSNVHPHYFHDYYRKLSRYSSRFLSREPVVLANYETDELPSIPQSFPTLEHGMDLLFTQIDFLCHIPTSIWHDTRRRQETQAAHVSYLLRWNVALAETTNLMTNRTLRQIHACFFMRVVRATIYLLLYLVLFLRSDTQRKLLDFDFLESGNVLEDADTAFPFSNVNPEDKRHVGVSDTGKDDDFDDESNYRSELAEAAARSHSQSHSQHTRDEHRMHPTDSETIVTSRELWDQIERDEDLLMNLSRIVILADSVVDKEFFLDNHPYTLSMNIDSGVGPPRSRIPQPESSSKTRHLVRSLLQPSLREKLLTETQPPTDVSLTHSLNPADPNASTSASLAASSSSNQSDTKARSMYNVAEQLCSLEEHAVFAAAKQSRIVPRGIQPRWLDVSCFLEERKMLIRYCCRDEKQGVLGPNGGIIWTQEWVKF